MKLLAQLFCFGLLAAAGNLLGGFLLTNLGDPKQARLKQLIALGAGFMLGTVFIEVIPEAAEQWNGQLTTVMAWALAGYLLIQLIEHTIAPHFHFGEETHTEEVLRQGVEIPHRDQAAQQRTDTHAEFIVSEKGCAEPD